MPWVEILVDGRPANVYVYAQAVEKRSEDDQLLGLILVTEARRNWNVLLYVRISSAVALCN